MLENQIECAFTDPDMTPFTLHTETLARPLPEKLEDLLEYSRHTIRSLWAKHTAQSLLNLPDSPGKRKILEICRSPENLNLLLLKDKLRDLETLKHEGELDLWLDILQAVSDRELASSQLAKHWLSEMSEEDISHFSLTRNEIILFLDLSLDIQKPIDNAYTKQLRLASLPGGNLPGENASISGYEYLYNETTPYIDMFPEEFTQLTDILRFHSQKILDQINQNLLPPSYQKLSSYLSLLADGLSSRETDPHLISLQWEKVENYYIDLAFSGFPILITPWGFVLEGNHIGIELSTTLNLSQNSTYYNRGLEYLKITQEFGQQYSPDFEVVPFVYQYMFARNGDNLPWSGTAVAGDQYIVFYDNENDDFSDHIYRSYYHSFLNGTTSEERFRYVRGVNTITHESGHLPRMLDESLHLKLGIGANLNKLDESKADCLGALLFLKNLNLRNTYITPDEFVEQCVVDYIDEIKCSLGHEKEDTGINWYAFSAKVLMYTLFTSKSIRWEGDRINIIDGYQGVASLARLGQEIFDLYGHPNSNEKTINQFVENFEDLFNQNPDLQKYLTKISYL